MKACGIALPRANKRLCEIYESTLSIAKQGDVVVDVGADHGYLAAMLSKSGKFAKVIATDISAPSLEKTKKLSQELELNIEARVGDGLLVAQDANMACVCGMGGYEIIKILEQTNKIQKFVLQPVQNVTELRLFLLKNKYKIVKDYVVCDKNKFYYIFVINGFGKNKYSKIEKYFGKNSSDKKQDFEAYLKNQLNKLKFLENFDIRFVDRNQKRELKQKIQYYELCKKILNK